MSIEIKKQLATLLHQALVHVAPEYQQTPIFIEKPKQAEHGDFATNLALQLAKKVKCNPREFAQQLVQALPINVLIEDVLIAGAGFINFKLTASAKTAIIAQILTKGDEFGVLSHKNEKIQVEFVSANPTGPLHVGHGRGAAIGDSIVRILRQAGYQVAAEYYVNDAGRQMDILATSTWLRYLELNHRTVVFPVNGYQGSYVVDMAKNLLTNHQQRFVVDSLVDMAQASAQLPSPDRQDDAAKVLREQYLDKLIAFAKQSLESNYEFIHNYVLNEQLSDCREDLKSFGVVFDNWFSEKSLYTTGTIERTLKKLDTAGYLYQQDGAVWFKSTAFGDEKDRVVQRDNGIYTYFASDIAYHLNKYERGFDQIINIWGADHHGYIARVKGAMQALDIPQDYLKVLLVQFASLYRDGAKVAMSTRSGDFVTLRQLRQDVGTDAARFFYAMRKSDQHLDFDLDLATSRTNENPVYYIQYAHARICSVLEQIHDLSHETMVNCDLTPLTSSYELDLCSQLTAFPEIIENCAQEFAPHLLVFYLKELAAMFHTWYNAERILVEDQSKRNARLSLSVAVKQVLKSGLNLLGISAPDRM